MNREWSNKAFAWLRVVYDKMLRMSFIDWLWMIALISTVLPIMEYCIVKAQTGEDGMISSWILLAIIYSFIAVYSEVYYANYLVKTHWWQDIIIAWWHRITNTKPKVGNGNGISDLIRKMEYFGLLLAPATFILGKPAVVIYANNKKSLPYGYWFLVGGWLLRLIIEFYGIKLIITLFNNAV